jgi:fibronectin-binding autotransporter adhesin
LRSRPGAELALGVLDMGVGGRHRDAEPVGDLGVGESIRVALEPFAGLAYVGLRSEGFVERGGAAALGVHGGSTNAGFSTLGLRASTSLPLGGADLTLRGTLAWRHAFGDVTPQALASLIGGGSFVVAGVPIARNAALIEAGLDLTLGRSTTLGLSYTGQLAQDAQDHAVKGTLAVKF